MVAVVAALVILTVGLVGAGLTVKQSRKQRLERLGEQARLKVIEAQLAGLGAALRIRAAEHDAIQQIRAELRVPDLGEGIEPDQPWLS